MRKTNWSEDDDLVLAEVVLRNIRSGSTINAAYKEVSDRLGRTEYACNFRWNNTVKHRYTQAIEIAKSQRESLQKREIQPTTVTKQEPTSQPEQLSFEVKEETEGPINIKAVVENLQQYNVLANKLLNKIDMCTEQTSSLQKEIDSLNNQVTYLQAGNDLLKKEAVKYKETIEAEQETNRQLRAEIAKLRQAETLSPEFVKMKEDYESLLTLLNKAREIATKN